jgi:Polyketide cyclase / dehydrase and lipid transport
MDEEQISWPTEFDPGLCPIHVRNDIIIAASSQVIWAWIIRAQHWPVWYPNSSEVQIVTGASLDLSADARFSWKTFGVRLVSHVREFSPYERIAWDAFGVGIRAYHAWLMAATSHGTHVRTEETQSGWLARAHKFFMPNRMSYYHDLWLHKLRESAECGMPPD